MLVCSAPRWTPAVQHHLRQQALIQLHACQVGKSNLILSDWLLSSDTFLDFLRVKPFERSSSDWFCFSPVPLVSTPSPAPRLLQVGANHELFRLLLLSRIYIQLLKAVLLLRAALNSQEFALLTHAENYLPVSSHHVSQISQTHSAPAPAPFPSSPLPSPPVTPSAMPQEVRLMFCLQ